MKRKTRRARDEDLPELLDLELGSMGPIWRSEDIITDRRSLKEYLRTSLRDDRMIVIEEEGEIRGFLHSFDYRDIVSGKKVREIVSLVVHEDHYGEGIGGELIENEREHSKEEGVNILKLEVLSSNEKGIKFYKNAGFEEKKKVMITKLDDR